MSLQFYDLMNVVITDLREVNILGDIQLRKCSYHSLENPSPFQNLKFEDTNTQISQVHLFPSGNIHYYFCCIISKYNIKINIHFLYIYIVYYDAHKHMTWCITLCVVLTLNATFRKLLEDVSVEFGVLVLLCITLDVRQTAVNSLCAVHMLL